MSYDEKHDNYRRHYQYNNIHKLNRQCNSKTGL